VVLFEEPFIGHWSIEHFSFLILGLLNCSKVTGQEMSNDR